uniref:Flap endonuclease GEN1 n=1 Tax=Brachionus koreanus TaxID=1199090 RepID=A0A7G7WNH5_9BILA|nr:Flap endonuclease GEN1 [Brachionus koreanus]
MGVLNLWKILSPCCNQIDLNELRNKTLAVDLSIWICENSAQSKSFSQTNTKPYLRALFFRCKYLLELNCKLIFVREGDVIDLKQETMKKRNIARFKNDNLTQSQCIQSIKPIQKRSRYDFIADECCELLKHLGITVIRSPCGEAEKACAYLNLIGRCDGVITEDSDVFLYGARTVYKNFSLDNKSICTIEEYNMNEIEQELGYNREMLIALALFLGCDYDQKGISGVGKEMACKFLSEMREKKINNVLDRLRSWSHDKFKSIEASKYEEKIRKLILSNGLKFPNEKIIKEFLEFSKMSKILLSEQKYLSIEWKRPSLMAIQIFNDIKQSWPYEYTCEKVIPLIVMYEHSIGNCSSLKPLRINKKKRRAFVEYYEVIWAKMDHLEDKDLSDLKEYVTYEKMNFLEKMYPSLVFDFNQENDAKKVKRKNKKKKEKTGEDDVFDDQMGNSIMELYENWDKKKDIKEKKTTRNNDVFDDELGKSIVELYENCESFNSNENMDKIKKKAVKKSSKLDNVIENENIKGEKTIEQKLQTKNFRIIVLDTESECEEIESEAPEVVEDIDLNVLLKSFNKMCVESAKNENTSKKMRKKKQIKDQENKCDGRKLTIDNENDDEIIEIPFSQRMKNIYKNAQIFE